MLLTTNWSVIITGSARVLFWAVGFCVCLCRPGLLGDVPYRRGFAVAAFGIAMVNSAIYTWAAAFDTVSGGVADLTSALGTLVAALFVAAVILSAFGPRTVGK